jgi:hypothetical protein
MFDINNVGIISSASICNGRQGTLLFVPPGSDSKKTAAAVDTAFDN